VIDQVRGERFGDRLIDFKSGTPRPQHESQVRLYAAMWIKAQERPVVGTTVVYADAPTAEFGPMTSSESLTTLDAVANRIADIRVALDQRPPVARPATEHCAHCPVRQLCPEYWAADDTRDLRWQPNDMDASGSGEGWRDLELHVGEATQTPNGFALPLVGGGTLFCLLPPICRPPSIEVFIRVRLLGVTLRQRRPSIDVVTSSSSEAFWLTD
jgi:PD-(D/E)XK nuclease superfamily